MLLLFLLLWLIAVDAPYLPEEEGIEVAFGDGEEGGGSEMEESEPMAQAEPAPAAPATPSNNDLIVSEEETLRLQKKAEEKERKRREEAEARRIAAEQAAAEKAAAEAAAAKAAAEQAAKDKASNLMAGRFGGKGSTGGSGTGNASGSTTAGNPVGHGTSGGYNWSLSGRNLQGKLTQPSYTGTAEGRVVVEIRVDKNGNVVSAKRGLGTNTGDQALIDAAIAEARKAKFSAGDGDVIGSITYVFKLK